MTLEALISNLTAFGAQDPHDTFYAVLNHAKDIYPTTGKEEDNINPNILDAVRKSVGLMSRGTNRKRFLVSYERPLFAVCKDFLECVFEREKSLDIICRPWVPDQSKFEKPCPSWLRKTHEAAYALRHDKSFMRARADSLVGSLVLGRRNYSASKPKDTLRTWSFGENKDYYNLNVKGFIADTVLERYTYALSGNIPPEWQTAGGWELQEEPVEPPEALWRTLVGDRGSNGLNPPEHWPLALNTALDLSVKGGPIDTRSLVDNPNTDTAFREFLRRVQEVIWSRSLIKSKSGHLGLAHEDVRENDCICILYGCSVPVVLRPAEESPSKTYYKFIGECYVHDLMEGEAFDQAREHNMLNENELPEQMFELR